MTPGQLRRSNLLAFIEQRHDGNKAEFADTIGVKRPQIYRYFPQTGKGQEPGEKFARRVELAYGLPERYFDQRANEEAANFLDKVQQRMATDDGFSLLVRLVLDDPNAPIPEEIRPTLKTMLDGLKKALLDAAGGPAGFAQVAGPPTSLTAGRR